MEQNKRSNEDFKMAKAPSEKHLEDWIVANPRRFGDVVEREIIPDGYEDSLGLQPFDDEYFLEPFFGRIITRQFPLPNGRTDLIARTGTSLHVVEIKKDALSYATLGQCVRYMYDLREVFFSTVYAIATDNTVNSDDYFYFPTFTLEQTEYPDGEVCGMIVGKSFDDPSLPLVAAAANVAVVTYEFDGGEYLFTRHDVGGKGKSHDYNEIAYGTLGQQFREIMYKRAANYRQYTKRGGAE